MTRLHLALITSLALHAMALLAAGTTQPLLSGQMLNSLSVQLVGNTQDAPKATHTQAEAARHAAGNYIEQVNSPVLLAKSERVVANSATDARDDIPPALATHTGHRPSTPASDIVPTAGDPPADTVNRIKAHLYTDLARHFDYPGIARQRGWEGRVMLAVNVASDGQLQQIRVARSSGFAILDDSALQSLRQVDRIGEAVALLNGRMLAMQIPVIYRLQGEP
jgi:TonB family protein